MPESLCFDWIVSYPIKTWLPGSTGQIGVGGIVIFFMYIFNAIITLLWIHLQRARASSGTEQAAKYVIFPLYIPFMWASAFSDFLMASIFAVGSMTNLQVSAEDSNTVSASIGAATVYGFQHVVLEGVAFLLMQYGCGIQSRRKAAKWSGAWGVITFMCQYLVYRNGIHNLAVLLIDGAWSMIQIVFYLCLWLLPMKFLFRRAALIYYARFWAIYRSIDMIASILVAYSDSSSNHTSEGFRDFCGCFYVFGSIFLFALCKPYVVYIALLRDSQWWQGGNDALMNQYNSDFYENTVNEEEPEASTHSIFSRLSYKRLGMAEDEEAGHAPAGRMNTSAKRRTPGMDAEYTLTNPLQGIEVGYNEAKDLAQQVANLHSQGNVKLLNFAYIMLDRTLLGSGSFSKVFKGTYKGGPVAIKLLFTPDLNPDVIRRCASEASVLSNIGGGSEATHRNVVKIYGVSVLPPSVCIVLEICQFGSLSDVIRGINYSTGGMPAYSSASLRDSFTSHLSGTSRHSLTAVEATQTKRPPLNLTLSDKYFLALGCARGLEALHSYKGNAYMLCHRDIKSFNFLVDHHLNAKIADLELSSTELLGRENETDMNQLMGKKVHQYAELSQQQHSPVNEQLPVWLAPEVIKDPENYTQASDIYALGLVLWEIMSTKVPYHDECGDSNPAVREMIMSGERPKFQPAMTRSNTYDDPSIASPAASSSTCYCNNNGYNILHSSYIQLTKQCWHSNPLSRPKIAEVVRILEHDCWSHTLHSYILETEYVIDPAIVMAEYKAKCKMPERKQFFTSALSTPATPCATPIGITMSASIPSNPSPAANVMIMPPSASFVASLMSTLKYDPNWLKLDACVATDADMNKYNGTTNSNSGGGYCVLSATHSAPYLVVWCTKYWLYHATMPISHSGVTMNDILAVELNYLLYDYMNQLMPKTRNALRKALSKVDIASDKALLNKNIEYTIATGRSSHCVISMMRPSMKAKLSTAQPAPPITSPLLPLSVEEWSVVKYSLHIFPVFGKPPGTTTPMVPDGGNMSVGAVSGTPATSSMLDIGIPIPTPMKYTASNPDTHLSINQSGSGSTLSQERSISSSGGFANSLKNMVTSSVAAVFHSASSVPGGGAGTEMNGPSASATPSSKSNTAPPKRSTAYVVIHFSNLSLPPLALSM